MSHVWSFFENSGTENIFKCSVCQTIIGFAKPGQGEPSATPSNWPADIDNYVGGCNTDKTPEERLSIIESRLAAAKIP